MKRGFFFDAQFQRDIDPTQEKLIQAIEYGRKLQDARLKPPAP